MQAVNSLRSQYCSSRLLTLKRPGVRLSGGGGAAGGNGNAQAIPQFFEAATNEEGRAVGYEPTFHCHVSRLQRTLSTG